MFIIPKSTLAQLAKQLVVSDARASLEAGPWAQVVQRKGSRRGAVGGPFEDSIHRIGGSVEPQAEGGGRAVGAC